MTPSPLTMEPRALTIRDLDRAAWAATLKAARVLRECNPNDADDRARFRAAKAEMVAMLPADADASDLIGQAVRWYALNDVAMAFAGMQAAELVQ